MSFFFSVVATDKLAYSPVNTPMGVYAGNSVKSSGCRYTQIAIKAGGDWEEGFSRRGRKVSQGNG